MKTFNKILFILILLLAAITRFWNLDQNPPSLNWDEISHGYNAYSLLKTGKDQWLQSWPIFNFRAYGDYPTTLNMYLTLPLVSLFGLNPLISRLPTAILGFLLIPLSFYLSRIFLKNTKPALFVALLVAISPWTLFTSRAVYQSTVALFFLLAGILLNYLSINTKKKWLLLPGTFFWLFSSFAYHNTKIVAPLLLLIFILLYKNEFVYLFKKFPRLIYSSLFLSLVLIVPLVFNILSSDSRARSSWVFILNDSAINTININRNQIENPIIGKLVANKATYFLPIFVNNYLQFLNPVNLFYKASGHHHYNLPNYGLIYSVLLPFFYLGFIATLLSLKKNKNNLFLILWWLIGLLPAALTTGDFPVLRAMTILPLPFIFIAKGVILTTYLFKNKLSKKILLVSITTLTLIQFLNYWKNYNYDFPKNYSQSWQYGYQQMVEYIKDNYQDYDQILITKKYGEPHEFILYYWPWDPKSYQNDTNKVTDYHSDWYWVDSFDKFTFLNDWEVQEKTKNIENKTLLITSPSNYNSDIFNKLTTIYFLNGQPAFDILQNE